MYIFSYHDCLFFYHTLTEFLTQVAMNPITSGEIHEPARTMILLLRAGHVLLARSQLCVVVLCQTDELVHVVGLDIPPTLLRDDALGEVYFMRLLRIGNPTLPIHIATPSLCVNTKSVQRKKFTLW